MSCRQRPEYRALTSSLTRQVEEFEVATSGGFWVAIGELTDVRAGYRQSQLFQQLRT